MTMGGRFPKQSKSRTERWPVVSIRRFDDESGMECASCPPEEGISFVIPAYNEAGAVGRVIINAFHALRRHGLPHEVIVIDDASTDGTADEARAAGARVLVHPYNRGYGNSLKSGITAARFERVIICDADGSYPVEQLPRLLHDADRYDMVVGARKGRQFYGSLPKRLGRWCQLALVRYVTGANVPDANSGFRLIRRSLALRYFDFVCTGFSFTTSITIAMICEQYAVRFVDIEYTRREGKSHVHYVRDTLRSLQIITHCILRYNPLKAFLLLSLVPLLLAGAPLASGDLTSAGIAGASACVCASVLVFAMGMLAYCVGGGNSSGKERAVDAGVYSRIEYAPTSPQREHRDKDNQLPVARKAA